MITVRHIQTHTDADGIVQPTLDEHGREIELWSVAIPPDVAHDGGAAITAYVAAELAKRAAAAPAPDASSASTEAK